MPQDTRIDKNSTNYKNFSCHETQYKSRQKQTEPNKFTIT
ncbi:unnamed protein product [Arabidopsis halleri]